MENKQSIFEDYLDEDKDLSQKLKKPRVWMVIFTALFGVFLLFAFYKFVILDAMSSDEVKKSIQVVWHDTKWVDKEVSPYEVKIVPSISFKIKNTGKRPLQYVDFEGVFEFEESGEKHSDGFAPAFKKPLLPGEVSEEIFIRSFYGYSASSKVAFSRNITEWRKMRVNLYARTKGSALVPIGETYTIKQVIEGIGKLEKFSEGKEKGSLNKETKEISRSLLIMWQDSEWVDKKMGPDRVKIVPSITFKVKNVGKKDLRDIYFRGEFELEETGEILGEGYTLALKKVLNPEKTSEAICIKSDFGYTSSSSVSFVKNIKEWKRSKVKIWAKSRESDYAVLGIFPVKQRIRGVKVIYESKQDKQKLIVPDK